MGQLKKILLVEDDPNDVELALEALESNGLANEVIHAKDGIDALDYLKCRNQYQGRACGHPAVIMLDLKMPRMDGLEALKEIRADDELKTIPVVMLTSSREEQDLIRSYQLGVNAYVVKPVDFKQFIEAVGQVGAFWAVLNQRPSSSCCES